MLSRMTGFIKMSLAGAIVFALGMGTATAAETIKLGAVAPTPGPLAVGASIPHWPHIKLWLTQVPGPGGPPIATGRRRTNTPTLTFPARVARATSPAL